MTYWQESPESCTIFPSSYLMLFRTWYQSFPIVQAVQYEKTVHVMTSLLVLLQLCDYVPKQLKHWKLCSVQL